MPPFHIAIIGKNFSGLKDYCLARGIHYTVFRDSQTAEPVPQPDTVFVDYRDMAGTIETIQSQDIRFDAVITVFEQYVAPAAEIAEALGLPGLSQEAAEACTDKFVMRSLFARAPRKISPDFQTVAGKEDLVAFAKSHSFPLILKPANLVKSLLVTKCHSLEELLDAYQKTLDLIPSVYARYAPRNEPQLLVEEFLAGSIHSIDAFVDADGNPELLEDIVDYQTGYDVGYDDNFHYSRLVPSALSVSAQKDLKDVALLGVKALGMKNSAAHIEIIMTRRGARIVEIGARNGGYRERLHRLANDIDIYGNLLKTMTGKKVDLRTRRHDPCAVLELFPKNAGIFDGLANQDKLEALPSLSYLSIKPVVGNRIGKSSDGFKSTANIILHNKDKKQFYKDLDFVNKQVFVQTV